MLGRGIDACVTPIKQPINQQLNQPTNHPTTQPVNQPVSEVRGVVTLSIVHSAPCIQHATARFDEIACCRFSVEETLTAPEA